MDPRALIAGIALLLVFPAHLACAPGRPAEEPTAAATAPAGASVTEPATPAAGAARGPAGPAPGPAASPEPVADLDASAALGLEASEGQVVIRTDVLRGHPVGAHLGPAFALWPGWRETLRAIARDPVADLDWIDVVGPTDTARERLLARTADGSADAAVEGRLVALQARSAEPGASHVEGDIPAAAARLDGALRVVFRPQRRYVAAAPVAGGPALSHRLARARVREPATEGFEAVQADIPHPRDALRLLPEAIRRVRARIFALPNGDADARAEGDCDSSADALAAAAALRSTIAMQNVPLVRMLTRGILDGITVTTEGTVVAIRAHATRDQLEAVLSVLAAMAPAGQAP